MITLFAEKMLTVFSTVIAVTTATMKSVVLPALLPVLNQRPIIIAPCRVWNCPSSIEDICGVVENV